MNILHVVNIYFVLPYFIGDQFLYFKQKGNDLFVACSESNFLADYAAKMGFDYMETPIDRSFNFNNDIKSIINICKYIKIKEIDIIVGHTPKGGLIAMIAGWLMRVPKRIYFRHGLVYETSHGVKRFILMNVDRIASLLATNIVCVSPSILKRSIDDHLSPFTSQVLLGNGTCNGIDTHGKYNPSNINLEKLARIKAKCGISTSEWVIGYSGRLVKDKGIIELVDAFKFIHQKHSDCKLLLMGMFEMRDSLPTYVIDEIKNNPQIVFTGFVNEDQEYYYALMNVFILPSYREGFGTSTIEAQAMGVPAIVTRVTGCIDSIIEGKTGLFVRNNAEDIALAIEEIYQHKEMASEMGDAGRQWVVDNFDNISVWNEIEKLYQR